MIRQNNRRSELLLEENNKKRQRREDFEKKATNKHCPGRKGPAVYVWEQDDGVWTRSYITRGLVNDYWCQFSSSQKFYNSIDQCWDLCSEFDANTPGEKWEFDWDCDFDIYLPKPPVDPTPTLPVVASDCPTMLIDSGTAAQLPLPLSKPASPNYQHPNPQSEGNFIAADAVTTLRDILYYRYGFSLNESPYTSIPSSVTKVETLRSWTEVCRAVGGQHLESSAEVDRDAIQDSQAHGPFALRSSGIIARLAREVLPNSNALSGPSYEALNGGRERFICDGEIYVDDSLSVDDLGLICGTYVLSGDANPGGNKFSFPSTKLLLI